MNKDELKAFVIESNRIEGILNAPKAEVIKAHEVFLDVEQIAIRHIETFVAAVAPGHSLRRRIGQNVRVGDHIAPFGGPDIEGLLQRLLDDLPRLDPYEAHLRYETLHPFTDGNSRSGRAIWLWQMLQLGGRDAAMARSLGFLHTHYYQSLAASRYRPIVVGYEIGDVLEVVTEDAAVVWQQVGAVPAEIGVSMEKRAKVIGMRLNGAKDLLKEVGVEKMP